MSEHTPGLLISRIAECANAMGLQSGEPAIEIAGQVVSHLAAHPEHVDRFIEEGNELWIDGTISFNSGCLSYMCGDGLVRMPSAHRTEQ